jgi:type I restriction enzyme M protein
VKSKAKSDRSGTTSGAGSLSNPLGVMEQITCPLFIKRLDELQTLAEAKARRSTSRWSGASVRKDLTAAAP